MKKHLWRPIPENAARLPEYQDEMAKKLKTLVAAMALANGRQQTINYLDTLGFDRDWLVFLGFSQKEILDILDT